MREAIRQSLENLRANKLRSVLTMFGILWGIVSIVVLSAMGEGFRRGNDAVLREFGRNIGIVWGGRTSMQAGGERAGRVIRLTVDDARAIERAGAAGVDAQPRDQPRRRAGEEPLQRGVGRRARHRAAVPGHPHHRAAVRPAPELGGRARSAARRAHRLGDEPSSCSARATRSASRSRIDGVRFTIVGRLRRKDQDSSYSGPDNNKIFIPFAVMSQILPIPNAEPGTLSQLIVSPTPGAVAEMPDILARRTGRVDDVDWPIEREMRGILARRKGFDPEDTRSHRDVEHGDAVAVLRAHRLLHAAVLHAGRPRDARARRHRRDEHHADRGQGSHARDRRAQGARRDHRARSSGSSSSRASC